MRLISAFKAFFILLGGSKKADRLYEVLRDQGNEQDASIHVQAGEPRPEIKSDRSSPLPGQSEAITLLTALQREGRFIDFMKESLQDYSAQEIGAACLAVHDDCAAVLERFFAIRPLSSAQEGESVSVETNNPARTTLSGQDGKPPWKGQLIHAGWLATKCDLPKWSGNPEDAQVISPSEVEVS